jgi:hypothetical protein
VSKPKTLGIQPAQAGALQVLQFNPLHANSSALQQAALEIASYHAPRGDQAERHSNLAAALADFLATIAVNAPPGPERSTAISRAREAKMWASAAVALEDL